MKSRTGPLGPPGRTVACGCGEPNWKVRTIVLVSALTLLVAGLLPTPGGTARHAADGDARSASCAPFDHRHAAWSGILRRYVRDGLVDYAGLQHRGDAKLSQYLHTLASVCPEDHARWTREERLAFWINAYNAYTVRLVLDHYPIASIRSIGLLPGAAFRRVFIPMQSLIGRKLSLDDIEHGILRKELQEPRIHFAIVCAAKSCPALRSEAYRATVLERQLEDQARRFVRDRSKNRFDADSRTLYLSSIFRWFREDFERDGEALVDYVVRYVDATMETSLREPDVRIEFLDSAHPVASTDGRTSTICSGGLVRSPLPLGVRGVNRISTSSIMTGR